MSSSSDIESVADMLTPGAAAVEQWKYLDPVGYVPIDYVIFNDIQAPDELDAAIEAAAVEDETGGA